jgi:hypothetical protein
LQTNFFAPGTFDPKILPASVAAGQPLGMGEALTIGGAANSLNPFTGPVLIITGQRDIPFCGGNCGDPGDPSVPNILNASVPIFPNASSVDTHIVSRSGHGLNFDYNHDTTYEHILQWLVKHGLGA